MRYKNFIVIIFILAAYSMMAAPASAIELCMWWRLDSQYRMSDGRINAAFELVMPETSTACAVDVYYRLTSRERLRRIRNYSDTETALYQTVLSANPAGKILFNISTGKNTYIELWARSLINGQTYYAQTAFAIFGNGGNMTQHAQAAVALPDWPRLEPVNIYSFYRAQVETPLNLKVRGMEAKAEPLHVLKNGEHLQLEILPDTGIYCYTPPYDEYLAKTGPRAKQDYVFAVKLSDGQGLLALTIPVYRGYIYRISYAGGFMVLGSTFLISLIIIMAKRRRFPYQ